MVVRSLLSTIINNIDQNIDVGTYIFIEHFDDRCIGI